MNEETEVVLAHLERAHDGQAWYGPALDELLRDLTPEQVTARPIPGAHNILELVLHISGWLDVLRRRLGGQRVDAPDEGDFQRLDRASSEAWTQTLAALHANRERLSKAIEELPESAWQDAVPGKPYNVRFMVTAIVQHSVYHAGQIALLRKLVV